MSDVKKEFLLELASPMDLMELEETRITANGPQKVYRLSIGIPFFLKNTKGEIENRYYTTTDCTNQEELGMLFKEKRVYIIKKLQ